MDPILGAALIFCLRIVDVSVSTIKFLYIVRGQRVAAAGLAFCEISVWLVAARLVFGHLDNWWNMFGFATGFATGTAVGMTIEKWIGSGHVLVRIISRDKSTSIFDAMHDAGFGLTTVNGRGREGEVVVLLVVIRRKRTSEALDIVRRQDPDAFVTVEPVNPAAGGFLFPAIAPTAIRKPLD